MGEYAKYKGTEIKIGTCEDMYYLRADQAHLVEAQYGNVDPVKDAGEIRFRFPFPEEDHIEPGHFEDYSKARRIWGARPPLEMTHGPVQFVAKGPGYVVSLPCPEGPEATQDDTGNMGAMIGGFRVGRNGFGGAVHLVQQRLWEGKLIGICRCGGCGALYRLETLEMAEEVAVALRAEADEQNRTAERNGTPGNAEVAKKIHLLADRLLAGYTEGPPEAIKRGIRFPTYVP